jgi:hypothetical protein
MRVLVFVDLDGTLVDPKVNNTYNFISFLYYHRLRSSTLLKLIMFIMTTFSYIVAAMLSKLHVKMDTNMVFVSIVIFCFRSKTLRLFSLYWLHLLLKKKLIRTNVIKRIIEIKTLFPGRVEVFVLTCCIEYPACLLAEKFGFKCLSRELRKKGGIVLGLKDIHLCYITKAAKYANVIKAFIKECSQRPFTVYIVDGASANDEKHLLKLFNKVIMV